VAGWHAEPDLKLGIPLNVTEVAQPNPTPVGPQRAAAGDSGLSKSGRRSSHGTTAFTFGARRCRAIASATKRNLATARR
jgi:hypothetical protein